MAHTIREVIQGVSAGGILPNTNIRAIVLQHSGQCRWWGGGMTERLIRAHNSLDAKDYFVKAKARGGILYPSSLTLIDGLIDQGPL